ncbi:MAG: hypothetical protein J6A85_06500 [Clostridia bacterium]|nr:hypothetical protein [Clostridia bacterium]
MKNDIKLLNNKERLSVPEIQAYMKCDYTAAKKYLHFCVEEGLVSDEPMGLYYPVNFRTVNPATLTPEQVDFIGTLISADELSLIAALKRKERIKLSERPEIQSSPQDYNCVLSQGLVHRFGEWYYLSITKESAEKLLEAPTDDLDDELILYVARPIVTYCLEKGKYPMEFLSNGFLPDSCRGYIERGYSHFSRLGKKPNYTKKLPKLKNKNVLKFELIEAFIGTYDYDTKQEYEDEAQIQLSALEAEEAFPEIFKEAARDAVNEICNELTYSNIREIRRIIKGS